MAPPAQVAQWHLWSRSKSASGLHSAPRVRRAREPWREVVGGQLQVVLWEQTCTSDFTFWIKAERARIMTTNDQMPEVLFQKPVIKSLLSVRALAFQERGAAAVGGTFHPGIIPGGWLNPVGSAPTPAVPALGDATTAQSVPAHAHAGPADRPGASVPGHASSKATCPPSLAEWTSGGQVRASAPRPSLPTDLKVLFLYYYIKQTFPRSGNPSHGFPSQCGSTSQTSSRTRSGAQTCF